MPVFASHVEQAPDRALLGVVRAGGVAGGGTDAAILFLDELGRAEIFVAAVAPLVADALVQAFGEGFGEAVGEGLGHDGVVVVVVGRKRSQSSLRPMPLVTAKAPMWSGRPVSLGAMKSASERQGSLPSRLACWRRKWKRSSAVCARAVGVELDVVADGVGREEAVDAARGDQLFCDDAVEQSVGFGEELACLLALLSCSRMRG